MWEASNARSSISVAPPTSAAQPRTLVGPDVEEGDLLGFRVGVSLLRCNVNGTPSSITMCSMSVLLPVAYSSV